MKLLKFSGTKWCPACKSLERSKTVQRFGEKYDDIEVVHVDEIPADEPTTDDEKKADAEASKYEVEYLPTLIFVADDGRELVRSDAVMSLRELEKLYKKALVELEDD